MFGCFLFEFQYMYIVDVYFINLKRWEVNECLYKYLIELDCEEMCWCQRSFMFLERLLIYNVVNVVMIESQKLFKKMKIILLIYKKNCFWNFNVRYNYIFD